MAVNENIMVRLTANISDYSAKMQTAAAQTDKLATTIVKPTNRARQFETAATKAGMAVGAMSLAFGVSAVKMFADFDEAMSEVKANTGATGNELESLKNAALDAGKSTVFNATESANAINELAKAGMSTADVLSGGLSGALNLAASDGMQVADAAELMSSALAQFKLEGKDAGAVADALAAGAAAAQGSASDLGYALSQAGLVANSFGISMQETVGALSLFANTGMIGSDAGTSLKSMLQRLAGPSKQAAATMEELGINAYDASGQFIGLEALAGQLQERMGGLSMEQRNAAMNTIFGADAVRAANALYEAGADGVAKWTKTVSESGVAAQMAAAKTDNLKGDMEQLSGAIETALIKTGSGANDALRGIVQGITGVVDAFASLDPSIQQWVVKGGLLIGVFAGLHKGLGDLKNSSTVVGKTLGLVFDPVQRLQQAIPQFAAGIGQLSSAMSSTVTGGELMANGLSRGQTAMSGLKSVGAGLFGLMGGPWGVALTAGGALLAAWANKAAQAAQKAKDFQSSLESGQDAITVMIEDMSAMKLGTNRVSEGFTQWKTGARDIPDVLDKIGISMNTISRAAIGDTNALDEYNAKYEELHNSWNMHDLNRAVVLKNVFEAEKNAYEDSTRLSEQKQEALDQETGAAQDAADGTSELTAAMEESQKAADEYATAVDDLIDSLFSMAAPALSAAQAQVQLDESIRETVENLTNQGRVLDENGNYLAGLQEKGEEAKTALYGLAGQAQDTARKFLEEGQATGDMEGATKRAGDALVSARDAFINAATAAGISREKAEELATTYGLTREETENMKNQLDELDKTIANPTVDANTDEANQKIDDTKLRLQSMPNGQFMVYGNNAQAMQALAEITGAKIDDKTGTLTLNKDQYDIALALANGAKIDTKTGYLKGENNDYWQKVAQANGWKIDKKTGFIYGNNGHALQSVKQVQQQKISDKNFSINALGAAAAEQQIGRLQQMQIGDKSFTVTTYYTSQGEKVHGGTIPKGNALGGYISGPGTGTSDSILRRVSNGEYITNARSTAKYRRELEAINGGYYEQFKAAAGYASGCYVQATPAAPYVEAARNEGRMVFNQTVTQNMYSTGSPQVQADLAAARARSATRGLLNGVR